jgi:hypothetical protein
MKQGRKGRASWRRAAEHLPAGAPLPSAGRQFPPRRQARGASTPAFLLMFSASYPSGARVALDLTNVPAQQAPSSSSFEVACKARPPSSPSSTPLPRARRSVGHGRRRLRRRRAGGQPVRRGG